MQNISVLESPKSETPANDFLPLLEKHRHELYRYALRTLWNPHMVEDVFQSAVLSAFENFHKFTPGTNFRAWVYQILVNKCYVANRETGRGARSLDDIDPDTVHVYERPEYGDVLEDPNSFLEQCGDEVIRAFERLSTAERSCILLRSSDGLSYQEIANSLRIPAGTVMTHLARGRAKLRTQLLDYATSSGVIAARGCNRRSRAATVSEPAFH